MKNEMNKRSRIVKEDKQVKDKCQDDVSFLHGELNDN